MNCTVRVCPEKDIVCSTPDECATRQTGCKMLIKLTFSPPAAPVEPPAQDAELIERIRALADCAYWATAGWDIPGDATQVIGRLAVKAAARLAALTAELSNARWNADIAEVDCSAYKFRAESAERKLAHAMRVLQDFYDDGYDRKRCGAALSDMDKGKS